MKKKLKKQERQQRREQGGERKEKVKNKSKWKEARYFYFPQHAELNSYKISFGTIHFKRLEFLKKFIKWIVFMTRKLGKASKAPNHRKVWLRGWASTEVKGCTKNICQSLVAYGSIEDTAQGPCEVRQIRDSHIKR